MSGTIQGNINQALGTLGVLANLSPDLRQRAENKRELRSISKSEAGLEEQLSQTLKPAMSGKYKEEESIVARENLYNLESARKRKYDLDPSKENYDSYLSAMRARSTYDQMLDSRREAAMSKATSIAQSKANQRREFMSYLAQQPTSLGGTVGDLEMPLQRQIASQYSKSQRKAMMDRMDKEAKNGKQ